jgi:PAS domain S-box-containing protein
VPYYICPNCKDRSIDIDGKEGLSDDAVACRRCGFGFLFELMDDYYPAPAAGMVVADQQGRILAIGRGVYELTGWGESDLIGADLVEAFGLSGFEADKNPAKLALEWGVRRLNEELELRTRGGIQKPVKGDFFPAYDDDGGLLVALTPRS